MLETWRFIRCAYFSVRMDEISNAIVEELIIFESRVVLRCSFPGDKFGIG